MIVKVITHDAITGAPTSSDEVVKTMEDYIKLRAACVRSSKAYLKGLQIVKNGHIEVFAYNNANDILAYLLDEISLEELHDRIEG